MKVKKLIKQLQKMPQNLEVYIAEHDNSEWEVSGETGSVTHYIKEDLRKEFGLDKNSFFYVCDFECFESNPEEWVTIHG